MPHSISCVLMKGTQLSINTFSALVLLDLSVNQSSPLRMFPCVGFLTLLSLGSAFSPLIIQSCVSSLVCLSNRLFLIFQINFLNLHRGKTFFAFNCKHILFYWASQILHFVQIVQSWLKQVYWHHFFNSICSVRVSVSYSGNSHNISNIFIIIVVVMVVCDPQWSLMFLLQKDCN